MKIITRTLCGVLLLLPIFSTPATAGVYTSELTKCVVENTSTEDKEGLIKYIVAAVSQHPIVAPMTTVTDDQRKDHNMFFASLFEKLLGDSCKAETQKAVQYEGIAAIGSAFEVLGQVAMTSMMSHPDVAAGLAEVDSYIDPKKLEEAFKPVQ